MPHNRFYTDKNLNEGAEISIDGQEHHHLNNVMRLKVGEKLELINGRGALASAIINSQNRRETHVTIDQIIHVEPQSLKVSLVIGPCKPKAIDLILQKGTEVGVDRFILYGMKTSRLESVVISAIKQCGRLWLPEIALAPSLEKVPIAGDQIFFGDLEVQSEMPNKVQAPAMLFVGPESGFSEKDLSYLRGVGTGILLHENVLRAETAAIVGSFLLHSRVV
ncbi:MAG: 16S rRNA (uracil(1498)-N(3))-methyltransferase [Simkaniaceae bacterium]|nr:16S rRNA (uracil(1498)-N(3))-methyltransferase [Simkaniaceae bacterium]